MNGSNNTSSSLEMLLSLSNPVFGNYMFWSSVLIIKLLLMSMLTALQRFRFKVFISPEDEVFTRKELVNDSDPHVDRVRRAHLNDMENILPFLSMGLIFVCLNPNATLAMILFRVQAVARIMHTLVYAFRPVPQPSRAIAFFVAYFVTIYMGLYALYNTVKFI